MALHTDLGGTRGALEQTERPRQLLGERRSGTVDERIGHGLPLHSLLSQAAAAGTPKSLGIHVHHYVFDSRDDDHAHIRNTSAGAGKMSPEAAQKIRNADRETSALLGSSRHHQNRSVTTRLHAWRNRLQAVPADRGSWRAA